MQSRGAIGCLSAGDAASFVGHGLILLLAGGLLAACSGEKKFNADFAKKGAKAVAKDKDEPETADAEPADDLSLDEIVKQCGVNTKDLEDPDAVVFEKTIRSFPKVFTGAKAAPIVGNVNFRVKVTTVISIKATLTKNVQSVDFEIEATPSKAEGPAREKTDPNRGSTESTTLNTEERVALIGEHKDWDGVFCTIQPVKEISTNKGGKGKVVKFDPPLPGSVSPRADPERYAAEIGDGRTFSGIKATVVGSSDDAVSKGDKFEGTVRITKVSPKLTVKIGDADTQSITADAAYKIEWDFGSVEDTVRLGLVPTQTMFISHEDRDIKAIVVDTGFKEGGTMVLADGI